MELVDKQLPFRFAKRHQVYLQSVSNVAADVVYVPPLSPMIFAELQRYVQVSLNLLPIAEDEFSTLLAQCYAAGDDLASGLVADMEDSYDLQQLADDLPKTQDLLDKDNDAPIIQLLNAILTQAIKQGASDVHFETFEQHLVVRFRIDGVLHEVLRPQRLLAGLVVSRIKVLAKLDIAEKRLPQDGRISLRIAGRSVDVRVSTMPASHGERVVLRLLDKQNAQLDLSQLGMSAHDYHVLEQLIHKPHGIVLVTGPTGSGKTTSLYAALTELNNSQRNIMTVEDPIEYDLPGVGQTQVNTKIDMTFAKGLRAILRQDPDVVMVGEIRDIETADIAIQASLTGHLVFATLHTNTAVGAMTRLRDMGVEPFLLSSSVLGVIAQRLVRLLCPHCKRQQAITEQEREVLGEQASDVTQIYHAVGCEQCKHMGYQGRSGIYEVIAVDQALRSMIHDGAGEIELERYARQSSAAIREDGWRRVIAGETTIDEVLRVTSGD